MQISRKGFTLVELMIVVTIVAIFAAIAIPSYQAYTRRAIAAQVQQEIQRLAEQFARHKGKNFSYLGFDPSYLYKDTGGSLVGYDPTTAQLTLPLNATGDSIRYVLSIKDGSDSTKLLTDMNALGQRWVIRAESTDPQNFTFLMTSTGVQCKNTAEDNVSFTGCGIGGENKW